MKLRDLFDKYKCDKGNIKHCYDRVYEPVLKEIQNDEFTLLEIGIFKGNSLEAFVEYCPKAKFVGIDTFQRIDPKDIPILSHDRVIGVKCNSITGPFDDVNKQQYDIIIDDGLHTHEAQWKTFNNFFPLLKKGGKYFIEDVFPFHLMSAEEKRHPWLIKHSPAFSDKEYKNLLDVISDYEVIHHDLRTKKNPDTYIIEVRK